MAQVAPLAWALRQLAGSLNRLKIPYMVIGGVANLVWGEPRITQDIDVTIRVGADQIDDTLKALNRSFTIPYEEQAIRRSVVRTVGGVRIKVATPEDLIVHKLVSERPRDREDALGVSETGG